MVFFFALIRCFQRFLIRSSALYSELTALRPDKRTCGYKLLVRFITDTPSRCASTNVIVVEAENAGNHSGLVCSTIYPSSPQPEASEEHTRTLETVDGASSRLKAKIASRYFSAALGMRGIFLGLNYPALSDIFASSSCVSL